MGLSDHDRVVRPGEMKAEQQELAHPRAPRLVCGRARSDRRDRRGQADVLARDHCQRPVVERLAERVANTELRLFPALEPEHHQGRVRGIRFEQPQLDEYALFVEAARDAEGFAGQEPQRLLRQVRPLGVSKRNDDLRRGPRRRRPAAEGLRRSVTLRGQKEQSEPSAAGKLLPLLKSFPNAWYPARACRGESSP